MHLTAADHAHTERNSQVHPALQPFVNSIAPAPLRKYLVLIGPRDEPRLRFEVMARDSFEARDRHESLCEGCERIEVEPILSAAEQWHADNDHRALVTQIAAQDRAEGMHRG